MDMPSGSHEVATWRQIMDFAFPSDFGGGVMSTSTMPRRPVRVLKQMKFFQDATCRPQPDG